MISVIVAAYNVAQYIDECVNSLLNQTFKEYEVIVINDSSTDNTLGILEKYKEKIKIIDSKENLGPSEARNKGVEIAQGEYIAFVDGDDYVRKDYLECLYSQMKEKNSICITSFNRNKLIKENKKDTVYLSKDQAIEYIFCDHKIGMSVWGKLFPREVLLLNPFPKGRYFEDMFIMDSCINNVNSVSFSLDETYFYRKNNLGIMKSEFSDKKIDDMREYNKRILDKYENTKYKESAVSRICINNLIVIKKSLKKEAYKLEMEIKYIKENYVTLLRSKAKLRFKLAAMIVVVNYKLLMVR